MSRLVGLAVVLALVGGGAMTLYNLYVYEVVSPVPLSWTHSPAEVELAELLRTRETLTRRLASARRVGSASGLAVITQENPGAEIEAELAALDRRIAAVRAELATGR